MDTPPPSDVSATLRRMRQDVIQLFNRHPKEAGETYSEHLRFTLGMAARFFYCGLALLIHGIFPFWFTRTGSTQTEKLHGIMRERAARPEPVKLDLAG